jgi:hypothetical protein
VSATIRSGVARRRLRVHLIEAEEEMARLGAASKTDAAEPASSLT